MLDKPAKEKYGWDRYQISKSNSLDPVFEKLKSLPPNARVLNLGSGAGRLEEMAPEGRTYAFDSVEIEGGAFMQHYNKLGKEKPPAQRPGDVFNHADVFDFLDDLARHPEKRPDIGISWRVIHNFDRDGQRKLMEKVGSVLEPGQEFIISVLSDDDWKGVEAKRRMEAGGGTFKTRELLELVDIMKLHDSKESFKQCVFSEQDVRDLAEEGGFEVIEQREIEDATGWKHLAANPETATVKYRYAVLRKK